MRVLALSPVFHRARAVYAPPGSAEDRAVRRVLRGLASELRPLPDPGDREVVRTHYTFEPPTVRVLTLGEAR